MSRRSRPRVRITEVKQKPDGSQIRVTTEADQGSFTLAYCLKYGLLWLIVVGAIVALLRRLEH